MLPHVLLCFLIVVQVFTKSPTPPTGTLPKAFNGIERHKEVEQWKQGLIKINKALSLVEDCYECLSIDEIPEFFEFLKSEFA